MKKGILLFLMSLLFSMAVDAQAQERCGEDFFCVNETNFYAKILSGVNFLDNTSIDENKATYQTGYIIAGSLGYSGRYGLCLEVEYTFRRNAIKKIHFFSKDFSKSGHFQASSYMANLLWHLPLSSFGCAFWNIQPFIGAGIGYDFQQMHSSNSRIIFNQKWNQVCWQVMTGLAYPILCNTEVTLEYKFHRSNTHFYNQSIGVGLAYKFDFLR